MFAHIHPRKTHLETTVILNVADDLVQGLILGHLFVGVKIDAVKSLPLSFRFSEFEHELADARSLMEWFHGNDIQQKTFFLDAHHQCADDLSVLLHDPYLMFADFMDIVHQHGARFPTDAFDVVSKGAVYTFRDGRCIFHASAAQMKLMYAHRHCLRVSLYGFQQAWSSTVILEIAYD